MDPRPYRTSFSRHIYSVLLNGFMARELDADDHEFLEQVRVKGIANGELPNTSLASVEELEFWQLPYDVAPDVERRPGPVALRERPIETPEQIAYRRARTNAWHARRTIREQERAIAKAELERETAEWVAANARRKAQEIMTDAAWAAADPFKGSRAPKPKFGKTVNRHYVPQWKLDEAAGGEGIDAAVAKQAKRTKRAAKRRLLDLTRQRAAAEAAEVEANRQRIADMAAEAERQRREAVIAEARKVIEHGLTGERAAPPMTGYSIPSLKAAIMALGRSTPGKVWKEDDMERVLGCERSALDRCLRDLVSAGQLRIIP
jgi:hypothetical protein